MKVLLAFLSLLTASYSWGSLLKRESALPRHTGVGKDGNNEAEVLIRFVEPLRAFIYLLIQVVDCNDPGGKRDRLRSTRNPIPPFSGCSQEPKRRLFYALDLVVFWMPRRDSVARMLIPRRCSPPHRPPRPLPSSLASSSSFGSCSWLLSFQWAVREF